MVEALLTNNAVECKRAKLAVASKEKAHVYTILQCSCSQIRAGAMVQEAEWGASIGKMRHTAVTNEWNMHAGRRLSALSS